MLRLQYRWEEAVVEFETALGLNRSLVWAFDYLAGCKLLTGSIEEVIPLEEQAIRISPRDPYIGWRYSAIGTVHLLQSRTDAAIVWLEKACIAIPASPVFRSRLASAYARAPHQEPVSLFDRSAVSPSRPGIDQGAARSRGQDWPERSAGHRRRRAKRS